MNVFDLLKDFGIASRGPYGAKREYHSACPGCGDTSKVDSDRFHVIPDTNNGSGAYWCRGCGKRGDNVQFCRDFLNMEFKAAAEKCGRTDLLTNDNKKKRRSPKPLTIPGDDQPVQTWKPNTYNHPPIQWQERGAKFIDDCHQALLENKPVMKWLESRGINNDAVVIHQLGWNVGEKGKDKFRHRLSWGLQPDGNKKKIWLPIGLVIPYIVDGAVLRLRIRRTKDAITERGPKYYVVPGSYMGTMILGSDRQAFVITEAELDAIACYESQNKAGAMAVMTLEGKPDRFAYSILVNCLQILNALDFGDTGAAATAGLRARTWWMSQFGDLYDRWPVPKGKDPGEAVQAGVDLGAWITAGLPPIMQMEVSGDSLGLSEEGGGANFIDEDVEPEEDLHPDVAELYELLVASNARIILTDDGEGVRVQHNIRWKGDNQDKTKRISKLVFLSDQVGALIDNHPQSVITAANLWVKG